MSIFGDIMSKIFGSSAKAGNFWRTFSIPRANKHYYDATIGIDIDRKGIRAARSDTDVTLGINIKHDAAGDR